MGRVDFPAVSARRIFSGIQPTGRKHLGNYIGAIRQYVIGQDQLDAAAGEEAIYCIVDLHAITVAYDPAELRERVYDTTAILLAAGLDPERCVLFRQGDVREHTELCWLLGGVTAWGDLNRMTQWKVKREQIEQQTGAFVSAGLFNYPVLQAADVLAYRATDVPVGDDQRQHIELTREVARRFNERFGDTFVVPEHRIPTMGARIMDLQDPTSKMSTTGGGEAGTIYVLDEPDAIRKKFRSAVTDSGREVRRAGSRRGGQGGHREPDRHPLRRPRRDPGDDRGGVRGLRIRRLQGGRGGCGRRFPHPRPRALRGAARESGGPRGDPRIRCREGAGHRGAGACGRPRGDGRRGASNSSITVRRRP